MYSFTSLIFVVSENMLLRELLSNIVLWHKYIPNINDVARSFVAISSDFCERNSNARHI